MQLNVMIAAGASGGCILGDKREIAVAEKARIGTKLAALAFTSKQSVQRLSCFLAADIP